MRHTRSRSPQPRPSWIRRRCARNSWGPWTCYDRLTDLVGRALKENPRESRAHVLAARVAASQHRFGEASAHLDRAGSLGARPQDLTPIRLSIWQATGAHLDETLAARRKAAEAKPSLNNLALLATTFIEIGKFEDADAAFGKALLANRDVSPFPVAWVCFERGVLWGERATIARPRPGSILVRASDRPLPDYTQARVHLAELFALDGDLARAESLLGPSLMASDPEGAWRLADVLAARGNREDANRLRLAAKTRYERLLGNYELAFADHAAEFYLGIGNEPARALALARRNLANRATARAFALAYTAAVRAGDQCTRNALDRQFATDGERDISSPIGGTCGTCAASAAVTRGRQRLLERHLRGSK